MGIISKPFHIFIHSALANEIKHGEWHGLLQIGAADLNVTFDITFEQFSDYISQLDRLFCEPDGSFVWVPDDGSWQVDGLLFDRNERLCMLELKGSCVRSRFEQLMDGLRVGAACSKVVQDVASGRFLEFDFFLNQTFNDDSLNR